MLTRAAILVVVAVCAFGLSPSDINRRLAELEAEKSRLLNQQRNTAPTSVHAASSRIEQLKVLRKNDVAVYNAQQHANRVRELKQVYDQQVSQCEADNAAAAAAAVAQAQAARAAQQRRASSGSAQAGYANWNRRVQQATEAWNKAKAAAETAENLASKLEQALRVADAAHAGQLRQRLATRRQEAAQQRSLQKGWLQDYQNAKKNADYFANQLRGGRRSL